MNMKKLNWLVIMCCFLSCGTESGTPETNPIPYELQFESGIDELSLPEGIREDLTNYEEGVLSALEGLFVDARERKLSVYLTSIEGEIRIANGDLIGSAMSLGGAISDGVMGVVSMSTSGLMNSDIKKGLSDRVRSLNMETRGIVESEIEKIESAALSSSLSKSFRLEYPKNTHLNNAVEKAVSEAMNESVLYWVESENLKKHQALFDALEELELRKIEVQSTLLMMNYYLNRNHAGTRGEFVNSLRSLMDSGTKKFSTGERRLDNALTEAMKILSELDNPSDEVQELLKFGNDELLGDFREYQRLFKKDLNRYFD